jgi:hypothetical protein
MSRGTRLPALLIPILAIAAMACKAAAPVTRRVEARSANYFLVGVQRDDAISVRISQISDNSPVRDAALAVTVAGLTDTATLGPDGSYTSKSPRFKTPGVVTVAFRVKRGAVSETLGGDFSAAAAAASPADPPRDGARRQMHWWILNIGIGLIAAWMLSRKSGGVAK